ncbi:biotin--[acetyl-CoA-carboxylase] ligase [bacterium]|nr:biotin--[acetyl-CoA-carboxylase] ligase [bacterium]
MESTNSELAKYSDEGAEEGLVIRALRQTAGKGRHGKSWFSPIGGHYLSFLLRPVIPLEHLNILPLAMGLAAAETIQKETNLEPKLKWQNDIFLSGKKVGGILIETKFSGERLLYLLCGIGLNLNQEISQFPDELSKTSTSLFIETDIMYELDEFTTKQLASIGRWYKVFLKGNIEKIMEDYRSRSLLKGKSVKIVDDMTYIGKVMDITDKGSLLIMTDTGEKELFSGSIIEIFE